MKIFSGKSFIVFLSLILASCGAKDDRQTKIRIVDLQGKSHPIITKTPELNNQALAMQGNASSGQGKFSNEIKEEEIPSQNLAAKDTDLATSSSETIQKTLQNYQPPVENRDDKMLAAGVAENKDQAAEYDLSDEAEKDKKSVKAKSVKKTAEKKISGGKKFFAQVGSFSSISNARRTLAEMKKFHQGKIETVEGEKTIYRVLIGPFSNKSQANAMIKKITSSGHEAVLVRSK